MTSLTIAITRTAKQAGTSTPDQLMQNPTAEMLATLPTYGHDINAVLSQSQMVLARHEFLVSSVFKIPENGTTETTVDGVKVVTTTFTVEDVSTVPGLTADNAYDMCISTRQAEAESLGLGDYYDWRQKYFDDHFITTHSTT